MKLMLQPPFKALWAGVDPFVAVEALQGQVYRELEGRRTLRTEVDGRGYFVKIHRGIGWGEIFKNLFSAKLPVLGAGQEWAAIERLHQAGVPTMTAVAYGERGANPAAQHSFIVTEELAPTISLEDYSLDWRAQPPAPAMKWALIQRVAEMTGACIALASITGIATSAISCCTRTGPSTRLASSCRSSTCTGLRPAPGSVAAGETRTWPPSIFPPWTSV